MSRKKLTSDQIAKLSNAEVLATASDKRNVPVLLQIRNNIRKAIALERRWERLRKAAQQRRAPE